MKSLYIIGSGGFSKQVIEIVEEVNLVKPQYKLIGIIDDNSQLKGKKVLNCEIIGDTDYLLEQTKNDDVSAVIAIGDGLIRSKIVDKLNNVNWVNLIHPSSIISKYTSIGNGNIISAGVIINPMCNIGDHCNINIGCTLGHDISVDNYTTIMPGCNISGFVSIEKLTMIGTGSCVIQNINIGEQTVIGAGSVVINDLPPNCTAVGAPARTIKFNK